MALSCLQQGREFFMGRNDAVVMFEGTIYEEGYGWVAQKVMRDREISIQAKAIYAYICSLAGNPIDINNRKAFPSVSLMKAELGIKSQDTFYKHMNQLKEKGYLKVEQEKDKFGKFKRNIYKVVAVPKPEENKKNDDQKEKKASEVEKEPYPKNWTTDEKPQSNFSTTENPTTEKPTTENWNTNSNSFNRNSFIKEEEENKIKTNEIESNLAYLELQDYLLEKGIDQETINEIINELNDMKLDTFLMKDVENQYVHMMEKLEKGEVNNHNGFAVYFANGLYMRSTQSKASFKYKQEKIQEYESSVLKNSSTKKIPLYDWLNN